MSELSELFERNHSRHRCRVCREIEEDRDALAKRVEELGDLLVRLSTYKDTDDYEEAYEAVHDESDAIATRRAGRAL